MNSLRMPQLILLIPLHNQNNTKKQPARFASGCHFFTRSKKLTYNLPIAVNNILGGVIHEEKFFIR